MYNEQILEADFELGFTYTRSTGPIIGKFFAALKQQQLYGIKANDGMVIFPPLEYDPRNSDSLDDFARVQDVGSVEAWTWIAQPREQHGMDKPFAFALVKLDGADTSFVHRLLCNSEADIEAGLRVKVQWAEERVGAITDIAGFTPLLDSEQEAA